VQTLETLRSEGFDVDVRDGRLVVRGHGRPSLEVQDALAEHRQRILQILMVPRHAPEPPGGRLHWQAFDHVCSTACTREHPDCNACGRPLRPHERRWPHLHLNCRLELAE
jgi:hypothetical protein